MTKRRLVYVEWVDSHSRQAAWHPVDELEEDASPLTCVSVGWLIKEKHGQRVILPHRYHRRHDDIREFGRGAMSIPTRSIVKMVTLREPR